LRFKKHRRDCRASRAAWPEAWGRATEKKVSASATGPASCNGVQVG
jgi:hypothetical protein